MKTKQNLKVICVPCNGFMDEKVSFSSRVRVIYVVPIV